ncbi:MAG: hypothetical protein ACM3JJ_11550 [Hyphomicrobiales bacterium]
MRQRAIIVALLLVGTGVVLGATVFRTDIAQATGLAQSVVVSNTASQAVPVREQNLEGGNVKVHEQGTARVRSDEDEVSVSTRLTSESFGCEGVLYTVPTGSRLVVEYIGGQVIATGDSPFGYIGVGGNPGFTPPDVRLPFVFQSQTDQVWTASEDVHYTFPAGTALKAEIIITGASSPVCNSADLSLGGHLQPNP